MRVNVRGKNKTKKWKDSYDIDEAAQQIIRQQATWNSEHQIGQSAAVTYSFSRWQEYYDAYDQLTERQQEQARIALESWADVANITFTEDATQTKQISILVILTALKIMHLLIYQMRATSRTMLV